MRTFEELLKQIESLEPIQCHEETRQLAIRAVAVRNQPVDIQEWARQLADDIKDAND